MPKTSSRIINGTSGVDTLYGDLRNGRPLVGNGADQTINGLGGNDTLYGDSFYGDSFIIDRTGHGGNDSLKGGDGNDTLYGDAYFRPRDRHDRARFRQLHR
jgi:Ca2+-binding RTX toxin-like protein